MGARALGPALRQGGTTKAPSRQATAAVFADAFALYQKQDMRGAADRFKEYLRLEPTDVSALNNLGDALRGNSMPSVEQGEESLEHQLILFQVFLQG